MMLKTMKITVSKNDFKTEPKKKKTEETLMSTKNVSSQAKHFIKRNNSYKLEEKPKVQSSSLTYLLYFLFIVFAAVFIAGVWKLFIVYSENSYSTATYSMLVESESSSEVTVVNKDERTATTLQVEKLSGDFLPAKSLSLQIPLDAKIETENNIFPEDLFSFQKLFLHMLGMSGVKFIGMTVFDYVETVAAFSNVKPNDRHALELRIEDGIASVTQEELDAAFRDPTIIQEGLSLEIINATETDGLAGRAANALGPLGINIVSLSSAGPVKTSLIKTNTASKTSQKISRILQIPVVFEPPSSIADITIILGQDFEKKLR